MRTVKSTQAAHVMKVGAPIALDASQALWPIASADGIICIKLVHVEGHNC
jgi:hypothetical protein